MFKIILAFFFFIISQFSEDSIQKIYALQYGKSEYSTELLNSNDDTKTKNILWVFYLIQTEKKNILVDTGFTDSRYIRMFQILNYIHPKDLLKKLKIETEDITDVILTHSHFDHIGGAHLFPNAKIYIQSKELEFLLTQEIYKDYEKVFTIRDNRNSVEKLGPNFYFSDYLTVYLSGGHTLGSQYVFLKSNQKEWVITGDECYFSIECLQGIGLNKKSAYSIENNKLFLQSLNKLYSKNPKLEVLTLHDSNLLIKYKSIDKGIIEIYSKEKKK